ncbi:MAG: penicillin-binding protein 2 [Rhodothermaceae bacterium]
MTEIFGSLARRRIIFMVMLGFGILVVFQLFNMQIFQHMAYDEKSQTNSVKGIEQDPPRGIFYDRNHKVLVSNKPTFSLEITPSMYDKNLTEMIEKIIHEDSGYVSTVLKKNRRFSLYQPRKIKRDVDFNFVAWYEENQSRLPGVGYSVDMQRDYSYGVKGSHIFGYIKEISARQLQEDKDFYSLGDYVGQKGIEKSYETILRGEKGLDYFLVDSKQKTIGEYRDGKQNVKAVKGNDLILTLDLETQKIAEKLFEGKKGSIIAVEPSTGEILSYVSAPDYDLNAFTAVTSENVLNSLRQDESKPLFNRPIMSIIPPGSTSKMLLVLAALEEGVITEDTKLYCGGSYQYGNRSWKCHGGVHGNITARQAIEGSCNTFFYQLILKLGFEKWTEYYKKFGFGKKTSIDIGGEYRGILPDDKYYVKRYGKNWPKGLLLNLSIGQGELSVTPIQLAQYVSLIANSGTTKQPHFLKGYIDQETHQMVEAPVKEIKVDIKKKNFDIVKEGMFDVVQGEHGTAKWYRIPGINIGGKTGTVQNPHGEDHALFVAFAPYENPEIAVVVMVENVGFGSTHAAPIARDVIRTYLENKNGKDKTIASNVSEN